MVVAAGHWIKVKDGDDRARGLQRRHYSHTKFRGFRKGPETDRTRRFVGAGEHMVLLTATCDAVFAWRRQDFRRDEEVGVECTLFRNEGPTLSSELIREAVELARERWPGARLFTFVDASSIRSSNPGYCFLMAGWSRTGRLTSRRGLVVLELAPNA